MPPLEPPLVPSRQSRGSWVNCSADHAGPTSIVHSELDNCNSLYYNLHKSQLKRFQLQNSLACAVYIVKAAKFSHALTYSQISSLA